MKFTLPLLLFVLQAGAANWYVDNAATGTRDGSSWANAWTNLNGITGIAAGDTVFISGGAVSKTYRDPYWEPSGGTAGNPITYRIGQDAGHTGRAIFDSQGVNLTWLWGAIKNIVIDGQYNGLRRFVITNTAGHGAVICNGSASLEIRGVEAWESFTFNPGTNIVLRNDYIQPFPPTNGSTPTYAVLWNVYPAVSQTASYTNNGIFQCQFVLPRSAATPAWGCDGIVGGQCTTYQSNVTTTIANMENVEWQHGDGWQNVATGGGGCWVIVCDSEFLNIGNYGVYWEMTGACSNALFFNNLFHHTDATVAAGATIGCVVGVQGANGLTYTNLVIANNSFGDNYGRTAASLGGIAYANTYQNCVIANNLTMNCGVAGGESALTAGDSTGTNGISIFKNLCVAGASGTTNVTLSQLVWPTGGFQVQFVFYSALSQANNFRLAASDTGALGRGADLSAYFTTDILGNSRGSTWDIGAYQGATPTKVMRATTIKGNLRRPY